MYQRLLLFSVLGRFSVFTLSTFKIFLHELFGHLVCQSDSAMTIKRYRLGPLMGLGALLWSIEEEVISFQVQHGRIIESVNLLYFDDILFDRDNITLANSDQVRTKR